MCQSLHSDITSTGDVYIVKVEHFSLKAQKLSDMQIHIGIERPYNTKEGHTRVSYSGTTGRQHCCRVEKI